MMENLIVRFWIIIWLNWFFEVVNLYYVIWFNEYCLMFVKICLLFCFIFGFLVGLRGYGLMWFVLIKMIFKRGSFRLILWDIFIG